MFFPDTISEILGKIRHRYDGGDLIDRMNYQYTALMVSVAALTLFSADYVGQPIQCWFPAEFMDSWESYAESYCFMKNTYFHTLREHIPYDYADRSNRQILYYQWVPIVLLLQATFFYLPYCFWNRYDSYSGVSVKSVLYGAAMVKKDVKAETRGMLAYVAAQHLQESLETQRDIKEIKGRALSSLLFGKWYGTYITGLYLFTKLLYVLNVLAQFFIMNRFLGTKYTFWGWGILKDLFNGVSWQESSHFPRVTMCDFQVRVLGNLHRWTVQCVLMINMFNEKVYIFFWWWFLLVGVLSVLSLFYWFFVCVFQHRRHRFVHQYLRVMQCVGAKPSVKEKGLMIKFVDESLRPDGVFLLRLIQTNGGDLLTGDIIKAMWDMWRPKHDPEHLEMLIAMGLVPNVEPPAEDLPGDA